MTPHLDRIFCPLCKNACYAESWLADVFEGLAACPLCEGQVPLRWVLWRVRPGDRVALLSGTVTVEAAGPDWVVTRDAEGKTKFHAGPDVHQDLARYKMVKV